MGVHKLWEILEPAKQVVPLEKLAGQSLCIDLSYWVIQLNKVNGGHVKDKPHLRGLFHRTRALMALNCHLVFVADGAIPGIKADTYNHRLGISGRPLENGSKLGGSLKRNKGSEFSRMIEESKALVAAFGFPCLTSLEEGEAQCADLNAAGFCEACFTADSDALLFGAQCVCKEICLGKSGEAGHVVFYDMVKIREQLGLGRNSLIALGILLGCDYFPGVHGLGPEKAQLLVKTIGEDKVLEVMRSEGPVTLAKRFFKSSRKQSEYENGCYEADNAARKAISAYWNPVCHPRTSEAVQSVLLTRPVQMGEIRKLCSHHFEWPSEKTDDYVLSKLAERDVQRMLSMQLRGSPCDDRLQYKVASIRKLRKLQGVEYYQVEWSGDPVISSSTVRADLVQRAYPCKVEAFIAQCAMKKIKPKPKSRKTTICQAEKLAEQMDRLSLNLSVSTLEGIKLTDNLTEHLRLQEHHSARSTKTLELNPNSGQETGRQHQEIGEIGKKKVEFIDLATPPRSTKSEYESEDEVREVTYVKADDRVLRRRYKEQIERKFSGNEEEHCERVKELKQFIARVKATTWDYHILVE